MLADYAVFNSCWKEMTDGKHFHRGSVSKYSQSSCTLAPVLLPQFLSWGWGEMGSAKLWAAPSPRPQLQGCSREPRGLGILRGNRKFRAVSQQMLCWHCASWPWITPRSQTVCSWAGWVLTVPAVPVAGWSAVGLTRSKPVLHWFCCSVNAARQHTVAAITLPEFVKYEW